MCRGLPADGQCHLGADKRQRDDKMISAEEAKQKLIEGNQKYLDAKAAAGDISKELRQKTAEEGQYPYAIIITCSDSRVIPESIFSAGP